MLSFLCEGSHVGYSVSLSDHLSALRRTKITQNESDKPENCNYSKGSRVKRRGEKRRGEISNFLEGREKQGIRQ